MGIETKGAAPESRCPRCSLVKEPTRAQQDTEGWPCFEPFHDGWADAERQRTEHQGQRIWTAAERAARGDDAATYRECRWTDFWRRGETNGLHWHEVEPPVRKPPPTPELEKQAQAIKDGAHRIGEFLDWLQEQGYHIGRYDDDDRAYDACEPFQALIAGFYGIDLAKIEQERRALLEHIREGQS